MCFMQHPGPGEKGLQWMLGLASEHKKWYRLWMGPTRPVVFLVHPEPIKDLLKTAEPKLIFSNGPYYCTLPWLGGFEIKVHQRAFEIVEDNEQSHGACIIFRSRFADRGRASLGSEPSPSDSRLPLRRPQALRPDLQRLR